MWEIYRNRFFQGITIFMVLILTSCISNDEEYVIITEINTVAESVVATAPNSTSTPTNTNAIKSTSSNFSIHIEASEMIKIAYISDQDGNSEVYLMQADGGNQINLSNHPAIDNEPVWSPDGSKLAFSSMRNDPNYDECSFHCVWNIYIYDFNTSEMKLLTHMYGDSPTWSPNGSQLAFRNIYEAKNGELFSDIYIVDADGSNLRNFTNHESHNYDPAWSPNGDQIMFQSDRNHEIDSFESSIYVLKINQNEITFLADVMSSEASWSPDGQQIVFTSDRDTPATEVYLINTDGSDLKQLTFTPRYEASPQWSPNGQYIAYLFGCEWDLGCEIWLIDSNSLKQNLIWRTNVDIGLPFLSWSLDSEEIYFVDEENNAQDIFQIDINTLQVENLTHSNGNNSYPVVRP